ncbi:outer-membrane lipoprotein carrier protein LolA [Luminiphilus syltensis]|nr:outer-membrane lipoprotein carrier protein LolA [Luminiphilus syltensis]
MRYRSLRLLLLLSGLWFHLAVAAGPDDRLLPSEGLQGSFQQQLVDADGVSLGSSEGRFAILTPHFFRWEITAPGSQLIISDGQDLWQLDRDLETATRRPLDPEMLSPMQLLTRSRAQLSEHYVLEASLDNLVLTPKADFSAPFRRLRIHFEGDVPSSIEVLDSLEQTISVDLTPDVGELPDATLFVMQLPPHIELVEQGTGRR